MPDDKSVPESELLRATDAAIVRQRRLALILTSLPVAGAIVFVIVVTTQITRLESERRQLELQTKTAQEQQEKLSQAMLNAGAQLTGLIQATTEIEDLIESKESFLRGIDEVRFLIAIRMRFDSLHEALDRLGDVAPQLKTARRWRRWITVIASSAAPVGLEVTDVMRKCIPATDRTVVRRSPNGFYALAVLGDGTFTTAYRLTVSFQKQGCAPGAYFTSTEGWEEAERAN